MSHVWVRVRSRKEAQPHRLVRRLSSRSMMTGQILAGNSPNDAVRYQIVIWLLIAVGCGFGSMIAVKMVSNKLFDDRERLRIDKISLKKP